ncbi:MAG TPA: DUF2933 domain-containing protein [Povalibacter sp.]
MLVSACWALAAAAAYVLIVHRVHVLEWLPLGLLLAGPLMHIFMHGRRNHPQHGPADSTRSAASSR